MHNVEVSAILLVLVLVLEIPQKIEDEEEDEESIVQTIKMVWATCP
jgi:hypothetical protein